MSILTILIIIGIAFIWKFCDEFLSKIVATILLLFLGVLISSTCVFNYMNENIHDYSFEHILIILLLLIGILGLSYIIYETIGIFTDNE